ncbi:MAG: shikimate dehydrogenase [Gallionellaceae bacterium]|jgi:shikimate dehydrogenase|nr:shikimate dehydrogenase [Gallionellaceae bacterium]
MTDRYAVIGNPVAHSKSPQIHRMFAEQTGEDISYEAILAPLDGFAATVGRLRKEGYKGCNITVPFKFEAFNIATELGERAQAAQAANTLKFAGQNIFGDNTDGVGLVRDIQENLGVRLDDRRVLLMGSGGAAYGVVLPLLAAGAKLTVANRTPDKARQLAAAFAAQGLISVSNYEDLRGRQFDVVINATSSGLSDEMPPLPEDIFAGNALGYDMMYGRETPFMAFAREHGARVADGLGMLVEQAAEAFFLWCNVRPETAPVIAALRKQQ